MKKIKNIKLMLLGLLAMGSMNAFGQAKFYAYDNLVYQVADGSDEATFMGLNAVVTSPSDDAVNDPSKISVPNEIKPRDTEGNIKTFKVTAIGTNWATAQTGLGSFGTQAITSALKTLAFAEKVKLTKAQVNDIFSSSFAANQLESITIGDARNVDKIGDGATVSFVNYIKTVNIAGITNDVDGDVEIAAKLFSGAAKLTSVSLPTKSPVIIGEDAFRGATTLKSFSFTGVKAIGASAFKSTALETVSIPSTVESIGAEAFDGSLTGATIKTLTIAAGDKLTTIPAAFAGQSVIETITISGKATTIAANAFADAKAVKKIDLTGAAELVTITSAFPASGYTALEEAYFAGTRIKGGLFSLKDITTLQKYSFPTTLEGALPTFEGCTSLIQLSPIPAGVTSIPAKGFYNVKKLGAIDLTGATALSSIGVSSFQNCAKLESIDFSATKIGAIPEKAFAMEYDVQTVETKDYTLYPNGKWYKFNTALTKVKLPDVTDLKKADGTDMYATFSIGKQAFLGTAKLAEVVNLGQKKITFGGIAAFFFSGIKSVDFTKAVIKNASGAYTSLTSIPTSTFSGAIALESVTLPEGISEIGDNAFLYCKSLTELKDNGLANLHSIGKQAFRKTALPKVDLTGATGQDEDGAYFFTEITKGAFADNAKLAEVKLPAQIKTIASGAFSYATSLASINLNETSITTLNNIFTYDLDAASGKENVNADEISLDELTSLVLIKSDEALPAIEKIADYALQFTGLEKVVIPSEVTDMGVGAFRACLNLAELEWKNVDPKVTTLPDETFRGDVKLAKVTFLALAKTSELTPIKDKEVFYMCDKDLLKVILTPDHFNVTDASGYGNGNRQYSTLDVEGNVQFAFNEKSGKANDGYYYATYYNQVNASWFDATKFDVFSAVVEGNKVVLKPATADGGYYKVSKYNGSNAKSAVCVVRSTDPKAVPELKSNDGSEYVSTFSNSQLQVSDGSAKGSKLSYIFKLSNVKGVVAFYRVTSGTFAEGKVYIDAEVAPARLAIVVEGEGEITGIENILGDEAAEDNAPVYNMQGVRVNAAQKGLYIKNGKKFIVK